MGQAHHPEQKSSIPAGFEGELGGHSIRPHSDLSDLSMDSADPLLSDPSVSALFDPTSDEYVIHYRPVPQAEIDAWLDSYVPDIKGAIEGDDACQG